MKTKIKELQGKIKDRRAKLAEVFEQAGTEMDMSKVKVLEGDSASKVEQIQAIDAEINDLAAELEPLEAAEGTLTRAKMQADALGEELEGHPLPPRAGNGAAVEQSLSEQIWEAGTFDELRGRDALVEDLDVQAALFQTSAGWEPEVTRSGRFVDKAVRPIQIVDVIPSGSTAQTAVKFLQEIVFDNKAAETGEGGEYKEVELKVEDEESPVRKITAFLPLTDEQLEDVPHAQSYVDRRLPLMLMQRLDGQIPNGDGEGDNLLGFLGTEGVQTQAVSTDPAPDAVYKAFTKTETVGQAVAGAVLINPENWQPIRLMRTNDGIYIWGSPSEAGPERIWGHTVVKAQAMPKGTALTGDFTTYSELAFKAGLEVKYADQHADDFKKGKQAVRARIRVALVVYRPAAFVQITGLAS